MKKSPVLLLAMGLLLAGCSKKQETAAVPKTNEVSSGNPLTAPVDYLGAVAKAKHVAEKTVDTASLKRAIELFHAQEDRFPKDLNELVAQHYLPALPALPVGMQYAYNPQTGEVGLVRTQP